MTGGNIIILGSIGDNFGAGMTGGMAFIHDPENTFENYVNPASITWQKPETKYWKEKLKSLIQEHLKETDSVIAKKILNDFENEINNFKQVCPVEMLDKFENPITLKDSISKAV